MIQCCSLLFPIKKSKPLDKVSKCFFNFFNIGSFNKSSFSLDRSETAGKATWDNPPIDRAKAKAGSLRLGEKIIKTKEGRK